MYCWVTHSRVGKVAECALPILVTDGSHLAQALDLAWELLLSFLARSIPIYCHHPSADSTS